MGEFKDLIELVIGILTIIATLFAAIRVLISYWAKQQKKIKELEGSILNKEILSLKEDVEKHAKSLSINNVKVSDVREELIKVNGRLEVISNKLETSNEKLNEFADDTKKRILSIEYTLANGELVSVGKGRVMIKPRKQD